MKGIIYTELLEYVEKHHGLALVDEICQIDELSTKGSYTAVGTYPDTDIHLILQYLVSNTGNSLDNVLESFGGHLFVSLSTAYSSMLTPYTSTFEMVEALDRFIHPSVKKLYPDAQPPSFRTIKKTDHILVVEYESERKMYSLALGLLRACVLHFDESIEVSINQNLSSPACVEFTLKKIDS